MGYNIIVLFCIICWIHLSINHYVMFNKQSNKSNTCDVNNNALVEQFFNIIFTEFHNTPPVCVCVQMCLDRPTYCYPNGCLRPPMIRKREDSTATAYPINRIQYNGRGPSKSVTFLVDSDKELIDDIFEGPVLNSYSGTERKEKINSNEIPSTTNPFKDLVFKYRKLPKLEMRYNLREKIKHTRSDSIKREQLDVSRTRWPINKHYLHGRQLLNRVNHYKRNDETRGTLLISMFPHVVTNGTIFKKSLTKREDVNDDNVDALYVYKPDAANFSIEALIDNLILSSLNNNSLNTKDNNTKRPSAMKESVSLKEIFDVKNKDVFQADVVVNDKSNIAPINIILINSTYDDMDTSKYIPKSNSINRNTYLEMISNMSKEIEKNNIIGIGLMKQIVKDKDVLDKFKDLSADRTISNFDVTINSSMGFNVSEKSTTIVEDTTARTESLPTVNQHITACTKTWKIPVLKVPNKKRRKQRIIRKLN